MKRNKYIVGVSRRVAADLTKPDRIMLADWVSDGYSLLDNPWDLCDGDCRPIGFTTALSLIKELAAAEGLGIDDPWADVPDISESEIPF